MGHDDRGSRPYRAAMESVLAYTGATAYVLVGVIAMAESGLFIGLVVPGETALILGGVLVSQGHVELAWMIPAAFVGAVVGDSVSYELGRRYGPRLVGSRMGRRVGDDRWLHARNYVRARGGRAVFFGRFVGVMRPLVPAIAGWARMPYRSFLVYNVAGAALWASGSILLGVLAGDSWTIVERWTARAGILVGLAVAIGITVLIVRSVSAERRRGRPASPGKVKRAEDREDGEALRVFELDGPHVLDERGKGSLGQRRRSSSRT